MVVERRRGGEERERARGCYGRLGDGCKKLVQALGGDEGS